MLRTKLHRARTLGAVGVSAAALGDDEDVAEAERFGEAGSPPPPSGPSALPAPPSVPSLPSMRSIPSAASAQWPPDTPSESSPWSQRAPPSSRVDMSSTTPPPPGRPLGAKLSFVTYASACAWAATHPERLSEGWAKYGLVGDAIGVEHQAWRAHFDAYPDERKEFLEQVESFKSHWRP